MPPPPVTLTFDLLTLKVVSESSVTQATSVPILLFLGLSVLDLGSMYATDRRQTPSSLNAPTQGRGHKNPIYNPHPNSLPREGPRKRDTTSRRIMVIMSSSEHTTPKCALLIPNPKPDNNPCQLLQNRAREASLVAHHKATRRRRDAALLPVLNLPTGFRFLALQGRLVAPIHVKLGRVDGHVDPLACVKFHINRHRGWECDPQNTKNFHFLAKSRPAPSPISKILGAFYTTSNYPTLVFQTSCDSLHRLRSYC